jgi:hypothetical protein
MPFLLLWLPIIIWSGMCGVAQDQARARAHKRPAENCDDR